ncbi:MAG TPA: tetratricopeptide repeat protein [Thermodesulfovibrionales bacterium]|nr:tetratricopeptide repeat protein [Thermodesulfovibrionales bacterium]
MGKDKLLGVAGTAERILIRIVLCCAIAVLCLSACALPRIIVLDDPLTPEEHLNLGVTYEKKGEDDNAMKEYKAASKKLPLAFVYMGNILFKKHDYEEAEYCYKKAIKKDPQNADAYNNLAWLYYMTLEKLDVAEKLVIKAIELRPERREIYLDTLMKIREVRHPK